MQEWTLDEFFSVFKTGEVDVELAKLRPPPRRIRMAATIVSKAVADVAARMKASGPQLNTYPVVIRDYATVQDKGFYDTIDGDTRCTIYRQEYPMIKVVRAIVFHPQFPDKFIFRFQQLINMTTQTVRHDTIADTIIKIQNIRNEYPTIKEAKAAVLEQGLVVTKSGKTVSGPYFDSMATCLRLPDDILQIIFADCESKGTDSCFQWSHILEQEYRNLAKSPHRLEDLKCITEMIRDKKLTVKDMKSEIVIMNGRREMEQVVSTVARKIKDCIRSEPYELALVHIGMGNYDRAWVTNGRNSPMFIKMLEGVKNFDTNMVRSASGGDDDGLDDDGGAGAGGGGARRVKPKRAPNWVFEASPYLEGYDDQTDGQTLPTPQENWQLRSSWAATVGDKITASVTDFAANGRLKTVDLILLDPPGNILKSGSSVILRDQFVEDDIIDMEVIVTKLANLDPDHRTAVVIWTPHQLMHMYIHNMTVGKKLTFVQPLYTMNSNPHSAGPSNKLQASTHIWLLFAVKESKFHNYPDNLKDNTTIGSRRYCDSVLVDFRVSPEDKVMSDTSDAMVRPEQKPVCEITRFIQQFSRKGGSVVDLCAGTGTTGVAALREGRRVFMLDRDSDVVAYGTSRMLKTCKNLDLREDGTSIGSN